VAEDRDASIKGKAAEHLVAATCILASGLKLNVSTSFVDDEGVDLVFHRRERSTTLAVQVKSRTMTTKGIAERQRFQGNVRDSTFRPRPDLYILFVPVDADEGTFPFVWFIPSKDFAKKTKVNSRKRRVFVSSMKADSQNQWRPYRLDRPELPDKILEVLKNLSKRTR
jgi:hypothetical protein